MDAARLERFELLRSLEPEVREALAAVAEEQHVPAGDDITRTREVGYHLWFIEEGELEVSRDGEHVATLWPGDHVGEVALMVTGQRTADVRAATDARLIVVFERDLRAIDRQHPELGRALRAASAARLP
jgi:CRP-like cAMP-binding protein